MQQPSLDELTPPTVQTYRGKYDPANPRAYKISRSKIENYTRCARCFYLDRRLGIEQPSMPPFLLNSAVDTLFKKEFDAHRAKGVAHPLMKTYKIDAVPFAHDKMNTWRENFVGVEYWHKPTNFWVHGAVDDIWQAPNGELIVVDYKATAKDSQPNLDGFWQQAYKRQMEIYQWLMRRQGFEVAPTGYFVYANGRTDPEAFDGKLEFDINVIPYKGDDSWVEPMIEKVHACLNSDEPPASNPDCEHCRYARLRQLKNV